MSDADQRTPIEREADDVAYLYAELPVSIRMEVRGYLRHVSDWFREFQDLPEARQQRIMHDFQYARDPRVPMPFPTARTMPDLAEPGVQRHSRARLTARKSTVMPVCGSEGSPVQCPHCGGALLARVALQATDPSARPADRASSSRSQSPPFPALEDKKPRKF